MRKAGRLSIYGQRYLFIYFALTAGGIRPALSSGVLWPAFGNTLSPKLSRPPEPLITNLSQPDLQRSSRKKGQEFSPSPKNGKKE